MSENFFYNKLVYEQLTDCSDVSLSKPEYRELEKTGADKIYFSGDFPAVLFKEVQSFNDCALREIAETQRKIWNYRKVIFLFALSDTEIRIYNCYEKPKYLKPDADVNTELKTYEIFKTQKNDAANLSILIELFSQTGVDCGLLWTSEHADIREKVHVQNRIDRYLVQSLMKTAEILGKDIKDKNIIHGLLMRSLFILYLEDKGAARKAGLYMEIQEDAGSYFDILDDVDSTYKLFDKLHEHFNGNVFPVIDGEQKLVTQKHLQKIKHCFIDGDVSDNPKLFDDWRVFDFSFIQIELLSEVYENFLGELKEKKEKGQFYTPYPLVELMLNDRLSIKHETNYNVKTLDIACGSGIFLVESYKRLIRRWKNANPNNNISFTELKDILLDNIYGIEIDPLAIKVAAFSLYLALVEQLDPKTLWIKKEYRLPYLINNPDDPSLKDKQGNNLWCRDTIGKINAQTFVIKADLLVGNPPFGTKEISPETKNYLEKNRYAQETVLAFLDKAVQFVKNEGKIALIFNTKVLTNTNKKYQNFRKWLFNKTYVEKVYNLSIFRKAKKDFGGQLFNSATVPVSIVYYQKKSPENISDTIEYCAPKTYMKSNIIDGLVIDSTDIKFLPRYECQKPDTKIWKIAMWGGQRDFAFLKRMEQNDSSLASDTKWIYGRGLCSDSLKPGFVPHKIIRTDAINRYYTDNSALQENKTYYRKDKDGDQLFAPPYIIVKKGQHDRKITASLIEYPAYCASGAYVFNGKNDISLDEKKVLTAYFNSDIIRYFLFLKSSSWGIEREQIFLNELIEIPSVFFEQNIECKAINQYFDNIVNSLTSELFNEQTISDNESSILKELYKLLHINPKEQILIEDTLKYNLDLFEQGEKSIGFERTLQNENELYASMLCEELNEFLQHSPLRVSATIYDVQLHDPLNLVVLSFGNEKTNLSLKNVSELRTQLKKLNEYAIQEKSKNIYVQKQFKYYDSDTLYLIKPNQKRFWTRSQAMDDAISLIIEIANMKNRI
jgi:hypothetical protein